jgi:hypothetical protein
MRLNGLSAACCALCSADCHRLQTVTSFTFKAAQQFQRLGMRLISLPAACCVLCSADWHKLKTVTSCTTCSIKAVQQLERLRMRLIALLAACCVLVSAGAQCTWCSCTGLAEHEQLGSEHAALHWLGEAQP